MELTVTGMKDARAPMRFQNLFGRYVRGFRPGIHCQLSFRYGIAKKIVPTMEDGTYHIEDELFYLCGVGLRDTKATPPELIQRHTNVHLAVRPRKGSFAMAGSVYGVQFVIKDAQQIAIELPEFSFPDVAQRFAGLAPLHYKCKMFRFGYQMFAVDQMPMDSMEYCTEFRDPWKSMPGVGVKFPV